MTEIHYAYEPQAERIVATDDAGQEVGVIEYTVNEDYWDARHTWVDPEFRSYGIARNLVNMLAEKAREMGIIPQDHDLIEGQYWNPGRLSYVVKGIQRGAGAAYHARQTWMKLRGDGAAAR